MNKYRKGKILNIIKISALIIFLIIFGLQRIKDSTSSKETESVVSMPDSGKKINYMEKDTGVIKTYDFKCFDDMWHSVFFIGRLVQ